MIFKKSISVLSSLPKFVMDTIMFYRCFFRVLKFPVLWISKVSKRDWTGYHIGHTESSHVHSNLASWLLNFGYHVDFFAGIRLMFIRLDTINYVIVIDIKALLLGLIAINPSMKKSHDCINQSKIACFTFTSMIKKLLVNYIQSITVSVQNKNWLNCAFSRGGIEFVLA